MSFGVSQKLEKLAESRNIEKEESIGLGWGERQDN